MFWFKCFVHCRRFYTDALFSEVLFVGLFRKVAFFSTDYFLLTYFFREYSGQISPLRNFTGSKFVLVTSQSYVL